MAGEYNKSFIEQHTVGEILNCLNEQQDTIREQDLLIARLKDERDELQKTIGLDADEIAHLEFIQKELVRACKKTRAFLVKFGLGGHKVEIIDRAINQSKGV